MTHAEIREKFLKFFKERGHKIVPSSSLLPTDPSVLFTTAGMQQFKSYYTGQADAMKDFGSLNTASIQKSMRTSDIDEVGDESHLTFFEMLGNFSFGGYRKKEAIEYAYEFITKEMGLDIDYVSVFAGELFDSAQDKSSDIPPDLESEQIWKLINSNIKIKKAGKEDNFWGPTGDEGPCGPTTEIYVNGVEIWNIVFNEYYCNKDKTFRKLETNGIDTGMGLDRLVSVVQKKNIFETDLFRPILELIPSELDIRTTRIIADHSRAIAFLITDGVRSSNKERGYVLRRLMRRIITYFNYRHDVSVVDNRHDVSVIRGTDITVMHDIFAKIIEIYGSIYPELNANMVIHEFDNEKEKFERTLAQGLKKLEKMDAVNAESAFKLYESFGLPYEVVKELGGEKAQELSRESFNEEFKKHQEKSRAGIEKKFGGHGLLLDTGELKASNEEELKKATRLHTATHLLHAALRKVLGNEVHQAGSDITAGRLRFDFTFPRKLTPEELKQIENVVNDAVKKNYKVTKEEMSYEDAVKSGALAFFKLKYPNRVFVYTIGPERFDRAHRRGLVEGQDHLSSNSLGLPFSRELCGGPHVSHTLEIGKVKITKEESVSAGIRRIRAIIME